MLHPRLILHQNKGNFPLWIPPPPFPFTTIVQEGGGEHTTDRSISWAWLVRLAKLYVCSLVPRPRSAFRRLQYRKAGQGLDTRLVCVGTLNSGFL